MQGSFLGFHYLWGDAPQLSELAHEVGSAGYGMKPVSMAYAGLICAYRIKCLKILKSSLKIKVYRHFSSKKRYRRIPQNIVTDF